MIKSSTLLYKLFIILLTSVYTQSIEIVVNSPLDDPAANLNLTGPLTVTNVITLRSAIQYANFVGGTNTINFNLKGMGPFLLAIGTGADVEGEPLPPIVTPLIINGYSQPGSNVATTSFCPLNTTTATILIVLNGSAITTGTFQDGLTLAAGSTSSVIQGLVIQNFPANGINIQGGNSQKIVGNYIGLNPTGAFSASNGGNGINIISGITDIMVGSIAIADRNVISGQKSLSDNLLAINGVGIYTEGSNGSIIGNFIGTDATGTNAVANRTGVYIFNPGPAVSLDNSIKCNTIQHNDGSGAIEGFGVIINGASANPLLANSIYNNDKSAIILINDGNNNIPAPIITGATTSGKTITANGTLSSPENPNTTFRVEFFVNTQNRFPITEGQTYVGQAMITTDGSGNAVFNYIRLPSTASPGQFISATATLLNSSNGTVETSVYSAAMVLAQGTIEGILSTAIYTKYCNRNDFPCMLCN